MIGDFLRSSGKYVAVKSVNYAGKKYSSTNNKLKAAISPKRLIAEQRKRDKAEATIAKKRLAKITKRAKRNG